MNTNHQTDSLLTSVAGGRAHRLLLLFLSLLVLALVMPGCGGCAEDDPAEQAEAEAEKAKGSKKEKPKKDFEDLKVHIQPEVPAAERARLFVKPGHWMTATEEMKANNFDFVGESQATLSARDGNVRAHYQTPFYVTNLRPAPLPKGTQKYFDLTFFVPRDVGMPRLTTELKTARGGTVIGWSPDFLSLMPPHQYFFVVLSQSPESFVRLRTLDSIRAPGRADDRLHDPHYRVVLPKVTRRAPLPSNALAWSSIAYVLLDDIDLTDPKVFDADQQQAMLDWLHWGGQLILTGPGTLDKLKGSFLDPENGSYLPAKAAETVKLSPEKVAELARYWTIPGPQGTTGRTIVVTRDWSAVELVKHPEATFVEHTANQVVERRIGRGRIVATSFRLNNANLVNWPNFDCFFNAVLLRRPPRRFVTTPDSLGLVMRWADYLNTSNDRALDARLTTTLRYFSRDVDDSGSFVTNGPHSEGLGETDDTIDYTSLPVADDSSDSGDMQFTSTQPRGSGVGGWNDFQGASGSARQSLREAAGITIPRASFVMFCLTIYLAVLVPLNWGIFKVLGRVEWAWFAAPLIAIGGALAVIKAAQLDIGFARSQTEVGVLEVHANYPRAHLSRYTALYSSLATTYDLVFEDKNALALPFASDPSFQPLRGQSLTNVVLRRDETESRMSGFTVESNSTAMVHSEQMFDLGGTITYSHKDGRHEIYNRTKYPLTSAGVIRRPLAKGPKLQVAWLDDMPPGVGRAAQFTDAPAKLPLLPQWNLAVAADAKSGQVSLQRLLNLAQAQAQLEPGEMRLIAIVRQPLPGLTVEPSASQSDRSATLVVAHLTRPPLSSNPPRPDLNCRADFKDIKDEEEETEMKDAASAGDPAAGE